MSLYLVMIIIGLWLSLHAYLLVDDLVFPRFSREKPRRLERPVIKSCDCNWQQDDIRMPCEMCGGDKSTAPARKVRRVFIGDSPFEMPAMEYRDGYGRMLTVDESLMDVQIEDRS